MRYGRSEESRCRLPYISIQYCIDRLFDEKRDALSAIIGGILHYIIIRFAANDSVQNDMLS